MGFPGGAVVENRPANAGETRSSPGLGRSHMLQSNWARVPQLLSLYFWSLCSTTREATTVRGPRTAMKSGPWTFLVAQWLRICLPMQGTRVWALVQEDPTSCGATKPVHHNYWACALEPKSHNYSAHMSQLLKPMLLESALQNEGSHHNETHVHHDEE